MINEEKVFSILDEIRASQKRVEARMDQMEARQEQVEARQAQTEDWQKQMEVRQEQTEDWQKQMEVRQEQTEDRHERSEDWHNQMVAGLDRFEATLTRVAVTLENEVMRDIHLLAEGHSALLEKMATKEEVAELRENDEFLEGEIRALSKRVFALEQAREPA